MTYRAALTRLQQAIVAHHMAKRSASTANLLVAVFEPAPSARALVAQGRCTITSSNRFILPGARAR